MKVFVSSVIQEMEIFRNAAAAGVRVLGHDVIRAEDFGASPATPQETCLAGVRGSDVVLLLIGEKYGFIQRSGLSATHEEYREAKESKDILVFVQKGVAREERQQEFLTEVQDWATGQYTEPFGTPDEVRDKVTQQLHALELSRQSGPVDEDEILDRALGLFPREGDAYAGSASLLLSIAGGPKQQVLRPSELENQSLARELMREGTYGSFPILDPGEGTRATLEGSVLSIEQSSMYIKLTELGELVIAQPAHGRSGRASGDLPALIEEEISERLRKSLNLAGWILDRIDPPKRLTDLVPVAAITRGSYLAWKTEGEQRETPNSYSLSSTSEHGPVHLTPATRKRAALQHDTTRLVQDLIALLRRQYR